MHRILGQTQERATVDCSSNITFYFHYWYKPCELAFPLHENAQLFGNTKGLNYVS